MGKTTEREKLLLPIGLLMEGVSRDAFRSVMTFDYAVSRKLEVRRRTAKGVARAATEPGVARQRVDLAEYLGRLEQLGARLVRPSSFC
jgi:hypothetical protein